MSSREPAAVSETPGARTPSAIVAVDVGGTSMKAAVLASDGAVLRRATVGSFEVGGDALLTLEALVVELLGAVDGGAASAAIGIATPGLVHPDSGRVEFAANLGWRDLDLGASLQTGLGVPVRVEHDARAAGRAELAAFSGSGVVPRDFLFVPIGTGISAAVISAGAMVTGALGAAGEIGHVIAVPGGALCACGQRGCVEAYASASAIARRYRMQGGSADLDSSGIAGLLGRDPLATSTWHEAVDALAAGIAAATALLDPQVVVIGGGLASAGPALLDPLRVAVGERLLWRRAPAIERTAVGPTAGLIGAALLQVPSADHATFVDRARRSLEGETARGANDEGALSI